MRAPTHMESMMKTTLIAAGLALALGAAGCLSSENRCDPQTDRGYCDGNVAYRCITMILAYDAPDWDHATDHLWKAMDCDTDVTMVSGGQTVGTYCTAIADTPLAFCAYEEQPNAQCPAAAEGEEYYFTSFCANQTDYQQCLFGYVATAGGSCGDYCVEPAGSTTVLCALEATVDAQCADVGAYCDSATDIVGCDSGYVVERGTCDFCVTGATSGEGFCALEGSENPLCAANGSDYPGVCDGTTRLFCQEGYVIDMIPDSAFCD